LKFAHIADTHIKNLKYHYEYRIIFEQLYETLREEKVDYIIHCGDIAHTKTQISPEFVELCSEFFANLANIAPTYIILGNHDGNLKNSSRQDAITPIVQALDMPTLHLLKNSGETLLGPSTAINVLSVFDRDNWESPSDPERINIALYHGSISNCTTDVGWKMEHGEDELRIFSEHDFAMLGDIHKRQYLDPEGRVWYCGSTIQQNFGETNDKGILIWEIEGKETFKVRPLQFRNPKPFITIELTPKGRMPKGLIVPPTARLRLVSNNNLPLNVMKRAVDIAKHRFKPESVTFLNRAAGSRGSVDLNGTGFLKENLRDVTVQEKLMREYLEGYEVGDDLIERVFALNQKYNTIAEENEDVARNVNWKLKSFEWDNLFNYGKNNKVDFENLNGIVGIFGKNFSGKSSIIDGLLYTMFNTTSKNERKNLNIINQNRESCKGSVEITIGSKVYSIDRSSEKYIKRLKGEETLEAKTDLEFNVYDPVLDETTSLNGVSRIQTDANIRKNLGTSEDFLLTSMSSQLDSLQFIKEGSTRRKEILAKFLDLEVFEKKFRYAKEDSADLKALIRRSANRQFDEELDIVKRDMGDNTEELETQKEICETTKQSLKAKEIELLQINETIESIPNDIIDILDVREKKEQLLADIEGQKEKKDTHYEAIGALKTTRDSLLKGLDETDINDLNATQNEIDEQSKDLETLVALAKSLQKEYNNKNKKLHLLDNIPCGDNFPTCKFIKDAYSVKNHVPVLQGEILSKLENAKEIKEYIDSLSPDQISLHINKYNEALVEYGNVVALLKDTQLEFERANSKILTLQNELNSLETDIFTYEENKEAIENFAYLVKQRTAAQKEIKTISTHCEECNEQILELYKENGSLEQKLENIKKQKKEQQDIQQEYAAYDLYLQCMHSNGIAYDIIKKQLPVINEEVAKVLANIVEFEIFFDDDGKRLNLFIKHPRHEPRPLEMGSGAEKTIASMAIRLALLSVSSLPKGDIFILDEPGTALDSENMEGFIRILQLIKMYFKTVILISHLESLKDCVDTQIVIDKKSGYARVNQ